MTNAILSYLNKHWQGPPIAVRIGASTRTIGQGTPRTTISVRQPQLLPRIFFSPSLTFGEAYMGGDITVEGNLMDVLEGFYRSRGINSAWLGRLRRRRAQSADSTQSAVSNAQHHYDIGNDFYKLWLDKAQTYSCAYFENGDETLDEAQFNKRDLICQKLRLEPGNVVLDIGAGWGSLLFHAAERYHVRTIGITPAKEQVAHIQHEAKQRGLEDRVQAIAGDWRTLNEKYQVNSFDRIVSVGMFEHVGVSQYQEFLTMWQRLLAPDGASLLHTIGHRKHGTNDPWLDRYIFPGGYLPSLAQIANVVGQTNLRIYRTENLRPHYAKTLAAWSANFQAVRPQVVKMFDEQFARMWWLYLQSSEAGFRFGELELFQLELYDSRATLPLNRRLNTKSFS